jgi:ribosomal protein L7/L12
MTTVTISGWFYGFQKVNFTKLLKSELGLTLKPAKTITDRILDGELVELEVPDEQVDRLLAAMTDLGAICEAPVAQR